MKYIKLFESGFNSFIEYKYNRSYEEINIYMDFFKQEWKFTGEIGKIPSIDEFEETYNNTFNENLGIILSQDSRRILISIGANNRALVHIYEPTMSEDTENKKRTTYTFNVLTDWGMMKTRWNNNKPSILDLLMESKQRGHNPILRIYQGKHKTISEGDPNTNILDNIFSTEIMDYINIMNKFDEYIYLIPYFIFFGKEDSVKRWWEDAKNDKSILTIT